MILLYRHCPCTFYSKLHCVWKVYGTTWKAWKRLLCVQRKKRSVVATTDVMKGYFNILIKSKQHTMPVVLGPNWTPRFANYVDLRLKCKVKGPWNHEAKALNASTISSYEIFRRFRLAQHANTSISNKYKTQHEYCQSSWRLSNSCFWPMLQFHAIQ